MLGAIVVGARCGGSPTAGSSRGMAIKDSTGNFENGLYALAGSVVLAAIVTVIGVQAPRYSISRAGPEATSAE
jgi:hypothetical protein